MPSQRECSPPLEVAALPPPTHTTALDRLGLDMWWLAADVGDMSDAERGEAKPHPQPPATPIDPALLSHLPSISTADVKAALAQIRAAAPLLKDAARSAFLPLPHKELLDPDAIPDEPETDIFDVPLCAEAATATATSALNPYLLAPPKIPKNRFRTLARSPLALSLPLTAADLDLDREIEPPSRHDWFTIYLSTLALFIWVAVLFTALDSGLVTEIWTQGFNWRVVPGAMTDPVRTWAVTDDVLGIAGVCKGGVCQWTPLV